MHEYISQPDIQIKQLAALRVLGLRFVAKNHLHFAQVCNEIRVAAQAASVTVNGYPIQIIYGDEYREDDVDTEFVLPIPDSWTEDVPLPTSGTMIVHELPATKAITYLHTGTLDKISHSAATLPYKLKGLMRIVYLRGLVFHLPVEEWTFEIQHSIDMT